MYGCNNLGIFLVYLLVQLPVATITGQSPVRPWACAYRIAQECGPTHQQQGCFLVHSALSLPPWAGPAAGTDAGGYDWWFKYRIPPDWHGPGKDRKGIDRRQELQHFLWVGGTLPNSEGHAEPRGPTSSKSSKHLSHSCYILTIFLSYSCHIPKIYSCHIPKIYYS